MGDNPLAIRIIHKSREHCAHARCGRNLYPRPCAWMVVDIFWVYYAPILPNFGLFCTILYNIGLFWTHFAPLCTHFDLLWTYFYLFRPILHANRPFERNSTPFNTLNHPFGRSEPQMTQFISTLHTKLLCKRCCQRGSLEDGPGLQAWFDALTVTMQAA